MLGVSLPVVDQTVVGYFASLLPKGVLSYLGSSNRIMVAAQATVGQAASVAAFPFLSELAARNDWPQFAKFMRDGLRRLLFVTLPLSTLMILLARPIVVLIYGYGNFDNAVALQQTSAALAFYCVGLFAWVAQQLVARGFYAMQDTLTPTIIGSLLTIFFFIPLTWATAHGYLFGGGAPGLAMATSVGACAHFLGVLLALENRLSARRFNAPLRVEKIGGLLLRTLTACIVMACAGLLVSRFFDNLFSDGKLGALAHLVITGGVSLATFAFCAQRFGISEWQWIAGRVLSRRKNPQS
jgi:putative peptidoglycan lipid II flippase